MWHPKVQVSRGHLKNVRKRATWKIQHYQPKLRLRLSVIGGQIAFKIFSGDFDIGDAFTTHIKRNSLMINPKIAVFDPY